MTHDDTEPGEMRRVTELIGDIRVALLTTVSLEGLFHTRPLETLQIEPDGTLWFFTGWGSPKVDELLHDRRVSLGYADPRKRLYLAVSGLASLLRDVEKARELWMPAQRAFFPAGPDDERLALLRVRIEHAEYWIAPGPASYRVAAARAAVTGTPAEVIGEDRKLRSGGDPR